MTWTEKDGVWTSDRYWKVFYKEGQNWIAEPPSQHGLIIGCDTAEQCMRWADDEQKRAEMLLASQSAIDNSKNSRSLDDDWNAHG